MGRARNGCRVYIYMGGWVDGMWCGRTVTYTENIYTRYITGFKRNRDLVRDVVFERSACGADLVLCLFREYKYIAARLSILLSKGFQVPNLACNKNGKICDNIYT